MHTALIQTPIASQATPPTNPKRSFTIILMLFLAILMLLAYTVGLLVWTGSYIISLKNFPDILVKRNVIAQEELPINISFLKNPIIYEWRGSVEGKLTKKDEHTFTLVDDKGNSITITDTLATGTRRKIRFLDRTTDKVQASSSEILLSDIPIGSVLLGDFFIFRDGPNIAVGSMFIRQQ